MSTVALKSLTLTAFRGSSGTFTLPFEKNRKLTLVYGENGTGKTTICDGLEFLAHGEVGSLKDKGMGRSLESYWPSANKTLADISVVLETRDDKACTARVANKNVVCEPDGARPRIELLRQQQITALVEAQPAKRYEVLQRFIDVAGYEKSEDTLRSLAKSLDGDLKNADSDVTQSFAALNDQYEAAGKPPGISVLDWAKGILADPAENVAKELDAAGLFRSALLAFSGYPDLLVERTNAVAAAKADLDAADDGLKQAVVAASANAGETVQLLAAGKHFLDAHPDVAVCPLCESAEKIEGLGASIAARLAQLAAVQEAQGKLTRANSAHSRTLAERNQLDTNYAASLQTYTDAKSGFNWPATYTFPASDPPQLISEIEAWLPNASAVAQSWADAEAALNARALQRTTVQKAIERYELNAARKEETEKLIPKVKQALEICVKARQEFTDKVMGEIAEQVGSLYEAVHPGEGLDKIAFQLDPKQKSSVKMQAEFAGKDVPPTAYFSQSHLDTLGLCVFLALALRDNAAEKILILDDVLGSVDEPHVDRVIDMLYGVSAKFRHTIITTHYRPWREKFRWGRLKPDQTCQFVELRLWEIDQGMGIRGAKPEIAWLKKYMAEDEKDLQTICGKAGVILEEILDYLTWLYECRLPRREGASYTLGELLDAVSGKLRAALKVEVRQLAEGADPVVIGIQLQSILDELSTISKIRNVVGAHFNKIAFEMPEADTVKFAGLVEQLADSIVCSEHGWPSRDKSGSYWSNGGDTRRLHPLKKPN